MLKLIDVEPLSFDKKRSVLFNIFDDHIEHVGLFLPVADFSGDLVLLLDDLLSLMLHISIIVSGPGSFDLVKDAIEVPIVKTIFGHEFFEIVVDPIEVIALFHRDSIVKHFEALKT